MRREKLSEPRGFTLIELMVTVAIIGVLAAIAIPAFLRYIKYSKTAEAESIMRKMAEGAKAYFVSEQRFSGAAGGEPWHPAGTGSSAAGLPIAWSNYVFPGASATSINTVEPECTGGLPDATGAPTRGGKKLPCLDIPPPPGSAQAAVMNKLRANVSDPLYFKYFYSSTGSGYTASAAVFAIADFTAGGIAHTIEQHVTVSPSQEVAVGPAFVINEFQ